jgi:hypothetical protein
MLFTLYFMPSIRYGGSLSYTKQHRFRAYQSGFYYHQNTTGEVAFEPISMGKLWLRHLFAEQGTQKVHMILQELRTQRPLNSPYSCKILEDPHERVTLVSDGSVKDSKGAFGWVAGTSNRTIVAKGSPKHRMLSSTSPGSLRYVNSNDHGRCQPEPTPVSSKVHPSVPKKKACKTPDSSMDQKDRPPTGC